MHLSRMSDCQWRCWCYSALLLNTLLYFTPNLIANHQQPRILSTTRYSYNIPVYSSPTTEAPKEESLASKQETQSQSFIRTLRCSTSPLQDTCKWRFVQMIKYRTDLCDLFYWTHTFEELLRNTYYFSGISSIESTHTQHLPSTLIPTLQNQYRDFDAK